MRRKMSGLLSLGLAFALTVSMLSGCGSQPAADSGAGQEEIHCRTWNMEEN